MKTITKAIAISDLHLGEEKSILNIKKNSGRENLSNLIKILEEQGKVDELIIIGDLVDFSLASLNEAYTDCKEFFKALSEIGNIDEIVIIPGNHDHHLWIQLVEQAEIIEKIRNGKVPVPAIDKPGETYIDKFVDRKFPDQELKSLFITNLWPKEKKMPKVSIKYPHHLRAFGDRYYLFTHGHFLEDIFKPLIVVIEPGSLAELEAFNCLWLEAVWYHLGQAGRLSRLIEDFYNRTVSNKEYKDIMKSIFKYLVKRFNLNIIQQLFLRCGLHFGLNFIRKKLDRTKGSLLRGQAINDDQKSKIKDYITSFILQRYSRERVKKPIPHPFSFIYGHTHRPFVNQSLEINGENYPLANTGGWLRNDGNNGDNAGILIIEEAGHRWQSFKEQITT